MPDETRERLRRHLFEELIPLPRETWPGDDVDLFEVGMDSVRVMRLLAFIEEELAVRIPDEAIVPEKLGRVSGLLELLEAHRER